MTIDKTVFYQTIIAVSETIRELREVVSGHLYNALLQRYPSMTSDEYQRIIDMLKRAKLVTQQNNVLRWTGPLLTETKQP